MLNSHFFDKIQVAVGNHKMALYGFTNQRDLLISHLTDMKRDEQPDKGEILWRKNSGNDHYFHSMAFNMIARRICEHLFQTGTNTSNFSIDVAAGDWMHNVSTLTPDRGVKKISRLGAFNGR